MYIYICIYKFMQMASVLQNSLFRGVTTPTSSLSKDDVADTESEKEEGQQSQQTVAGGAAAAGGGGGGGGVRIVCFNLSMHVIHQS